MNAMAGFDAVGEEVPSTLLSVVAPPGEFVFAPESVLQHVHVFSLGLSAGIIEDVLALSEERELIALENSDEEAGEAISNMGGFHSEQDLFNSKQR